MHQKQSNSKLHIEEKTEQTECLDGDGENTESTEESIEGDFNMNSTEIADLPKRYFFDE